MIQSSHLFVLKFNCWQQKWTKCKAACRWMVRIIICIRVEVSPDHQAIFSQTVREVFSPSLHLSAATQPSRLPSLPVSKSLLPSVSVSSAVGGVPWQLGRGARGSPVARGRKSAATSPAGSQQQVLWRLQALDTCSPVYGSRHFHTGGSAENCCFNLCSL